MGACKFCQVLEGKAAAEIVHEDEISFAFLDIRPLFPGHTLLVPKQHCETLPELAPELAGPFFQNVQLLSRAVEEAAGAEGSFVAINNRVSQSVPHLHVHVVPRRRGDGLRGFFWPRQQYRDAAHASETAALIRQAIARFRQ